MRESVITLWENAIPAEAMPAYPTYTLKTAQGGEQTFFADQIIRISDTRERVLVGVREAKPDELLRDPTLKFIPDWTENLLFRVETLYKSQNDEATRDLLMRCCRSSILFFANVFCYSYDPRLVNRRRTPFVSYPIQDHALQWIVYLVKFQQSGLLEKSRDMGASWMSVIAATWMALFYDGMEGMFMSMRENDVDDRTMDSLLGKIRFLLNNLPEWMRAGWVERSTYDNSMKIELPETGGLLKGILSQGTAGRSGRASIGIFDEFAFVEDSHHVLDATSELANAKIYQSTPNGAGNAFGEMAEDDTTEKLTMHWTDHPLKNELWAKWRLGQVDMTDERWAQEQDISYEKSTIGRVFPGFRSTRQGDAPWCHVSTEPYAQYEPAYDVLTTTDLGVSDPCSTLWAQLKPVPPELKGYGWEWLMVFFEEHEARGMTALDLRWLLNQKGYRYSRNICDWRSGNQRDSSGRTWVVNLQDTKADVTYSNFFGHIINPGAPILMDGHLSDELTTLENMRLLLDEPGAIVFNKEGCPNAIRGMQNWKFPIDKETRQPRTDSSPDHGRWSHVCKAILYLVDDIFITKIGRQEDPGPWDYPARRVQIR